MKTTLVLPAYNEDEHISDLIYRAFKYVDQIIVVDDCSGDQTFEKARDAGAITLRHHVNLGKSSALKTGCDAAMILGTDLIALMDSDGQHNPDDLPRFFQAIEKEDLDIVVGSRLGGDKMPFIRKYGNLLLEYTSKVLFHIDIKDIQSGFRVFRSDIYAKIKWLSNNYHADAEMTIQIAINKLKYKEIYIETIYLDDYKGMTPVDGLLLLFNLIKWRIIL